MRIEGIRERAKEAIEIFKEKREKQEAAKRLPKQFERMRTSIEQEEWGDANLAKGQVNRILQKYPELGDKQLRADLEKLEPTLASGIHRTRVKTGITDAQAFNDAKKCTRKKSLIHTAELAKLWRQLQVITDKDPEYPKAKRLARRLERCRGYIENAQENMLCKVGGTLRKKLVDKLDTIFLDSGMDVRMRLSRECKTRVRLNWPLWNRAVIHRLNKESGLLEQLEEAGFERVDFDNGTETTYYTFEPLDLEAQVKKALKSDGLAAPLEL
jgi:hypothetical protein